jgi:hypothetical protein
MMNVRPQKPYSLRQASAVETLRTANNRKVRYGHEEAPSEEANVDVLRVQMLSERPESNGPVNVWFTRSLSGASSSSQIVPASGG